MHKISRVLLACLILFSACKKDEPVIDCDTDSNVENPCLIDGCENFIQKLYENPVIVTFVKDSVQKKAPCFNPKNSNEFAFIDIDHSNGQKSLKVFEISSRSQRLIVSNQGIIGQPDWGSNGWILFVSDDYSLWKIRENGLNLQRLDSVSGYQHATWNHDGTKILGNFAPANKPTSEALSIILDSAGNHIDTLLGKNLFFADWDESNQIIGLESYPSFEYLQWGNFNIDDWKKLDSPLEGKGQILDAKWKNSSEFVFSRSNVGLYTQNTEGSETKVQNGCDSKSYAFLSYSMESNKIVAEVIQRRHEGQSVISVIEKSIIVQLDPDGCNEKILLQ
ncbi:hypothetical protein KFE98_02055 [bacterium SCSIO 12741]|nr:hypothetical protein KFE98_02055 [bacterium SCSIO 12741]